MLVITRKADESITLHAADGSIVFTVNRISGNRVSIGIDAPASVIVHRTESTPPHGTRNDDQTETRAA